MFPKVIAIGKLRGMSDEVVKERVLEDLLACGEKVSHMIHTIPDPWIGTTPV